MCCAVATSGWVKGMSYTLGLPTLASSPSPNDITLVRGHIPAVLSAWRKTVDILGGLCKTVSLCVRSLAEISVHGRAVSLLTTGLKRQWLNAKSCYLYSSQFLQAVHEWK